MISLEKLDIKYEFYRAESILTVVMDFCDGDDSERALSIELLDKVLLRIHEIRAALEKDDVIRSASLPHCSDERRGGA
ncbi:hypothetical protein RF240_20080 [Dickeya dadantii]|uniref:hypothetical protein n=1 Tax=Dickeya dadantii TaxID=204038 RepID=UPI0035A8E69E